MKCLVQVLQALTLVIVLGVTGCASVFTPRYATESEVVAARGEPGTRRDNGDGTFTLEYSTQPEGTSCLMLQVDATGQVVKQWDALDDDTLDLVKPGMYKDEVARLLGARRSEKVFPASGDEVWDWKVARDGTLFSVRFVRGKIENIAYVYPRPRYYYDDDWFWGPTMFYPAVGFYLWSMDMRFRGRHWGGSWRHGGGHINNGGHRRK